MLIYWPNSWPPRRIIPRCSWQPAFSVADESSCHKFSPWTFLSSLMSLGRPPRDELARASRSSSPSRRFQFLQYVLVLQDTVFYSMTNQCLMAPLEPVRQPHYRRFKRLMLFVFLLDPSWSSMRTQPMTIRIYASFMHNKLPRGTRACSYSYVPGVEGSRTAKIGGSCPHIILLFRICCPPSLVTRM